MITPWLLAEGAKRPLRTRRLSLPFTVARPQLALAIGIGMPGGVPDAAAGEEHRRQQQEMRLHGRCTRMRPWISEIQSRSVLSPKMPISLEASMM